MATMTVKIYTTATCVYCRAEKDYLCKQGVVFTEIPVDTDEAAAEEMIRLSGQMSVPFTVINKPDGEERIVGFDQQRLAEALGLKDKK